MIGEQIRFLRDRAGISQSELSKKLGVTRSSVNAWESGLSAPTAVYLIDLAKFFHVSTDFLLGLTTEHEINLSNFTEEEIKIIYSLIRYFEDSKHN